MTTRQPTAEEAELVLEVGELLIGKLYRTLAIMEHPPEGEEDYNQDAREHDLKTLRGLVVELEVTIGNLGTFPGDR